MKRKLLLPTDFSKNSWHAIQYAQELYKDDKCDFYILNVYSTTGNIIDSLLNMGPGIELYEMSKTESESDMAQVLNKLTLKQIQNPKHKFYPISAFNNIIEAIKNCVEEYDIEIIVMGSKGKSPSSNAIFGSTSLRVMDKVRNCPVLVIPEHTKQEMPKEIVFPTSFKTNFKIRELEYLIDIAKKCKASVKVLHISTEEKLNDRQLRNKELLKEHLETIDYSIHTSIQKNIPVALKCFVESRNSDMVAFINKKHLLYTSILTQPLARQISYDPKVPILALHDLRN